jgi:GNAT superfamily N-acetyltransferase
MNSISIRLMTRDDFGFADSLRAQMGWNQTLHDWERFLTCEPEGCFVAQWSGQAVGTSTITCYGTALGWVGMVLVHPDYRRRGIGSALLRHCLDEFHRRGVRCVKLDATPLGRPVYERLGFKPELSLTRWERPAVNAVPSQTPRGVPEWQESDMQPMVALDQAVFGHERRRLLTELARRALGVVVSKGSWELEGYGMLREGTRACYLGPVVTPSAEMAGRFIEDLLLRATNRPVFWDVLDENREATALARKLGFVPQRPLLRMFLGENPGPGDALRQFAIIDPAVG